MNAEPKKKVFRFRPGRVVEIAHDRKGYGYLVAAFQRPRFGSFFSLIREVFESPIADAELASLAQEPRTTVWLNCSGLLRREGPVEFRVRADLASFPPTCSRFWFGPELGPITLEEEDGRRAFEVSALTLILLEREMERRGYVHKVLWLPSAISEFLFEDRPLSWSAHKKY